MKNKNDTIISGLLKFSIGPVGGAAISFLTLPITTSLVSPEEFGKSTMFTLVQALTTSFLYLGMDHAYVREYNEFEDKHKVLFNALIFPLALAIIISSISVMFAGQISQLIFETDLEMVVYIYAIWLPFVAIENLLLANIRMKENGLAFSFFNIFLRLSILILTVFFLVLWSKSYISIIMATVFGQILVDIILILYSRKELKFKIDYFDKDLVRKMLKFGLPWIPAAVIGWLLTSSDRIFLGKLTSYEQVGIYFAAMKIIAVLGVIQSVVISYWSPVSYGWRSEGGEDEKFTVGNQASMFLMALLFMSILFFKDILIGILSPEYSAAAVIAPFLLFYPIMNTVSHMTSLGIAFSRKTHYNIWISTVAAISNIILNIILIPLWGAIGAAVATGVSYIIFFWIRTLISRKLWYAFNLKYYFISIFILLIGATTNVLIRGYLIYIINILLILIILFYNREIIQLALKYNRGVNLLKFNKR